MKKTEEGIATILIVIGIVGVILVAFGGYLLGKSDQTGSIATPPKTEEVTLDDSTPASKLSFQEILRDFCQTKQLYGTNNKPAATIDTIDLDKLPVSFGLDLVFDKNDDTATSCFSSKSGKGYVLIRYNADYELMIYDDKTEEPGHGGPSFFGPVGALVDSKSDPKLYVYLGWPSGGDALVGEIPIYIRGLRDIKLKNGETVHVVTNRLMLDEKDPSLIAFLKKHTDPQKPGENVLYGQGIEQTYILEEMKNPSPAQKEAIEFVNSVLKDIKAR